MIDVVYSDAGSIKLTFQAQFLLVDAESLKSLLNMIFILSNIF